MSNFQVGPCGLQFAIHLQSCNHAIHANVVMNLKRQISRKIDGVNLLHAMIFI